MAKQVTYEVSLLAGGTVYKSLSRHKAEAEFADLVEKLPDHQIYLQAWMGSKMLSERIGNYRQKEER